MSLPRRSKFVTQTSLFLSAALVNLPFGFCRQHYTEKFSVPWLVAIHLPVPFVVYLRRRINAGVVSRRVSLAISLVGAFSGQLLGGIRTISMKKSNVAMDITSG